MSGDVENLLTSDFDDAQVSSSITTLIDSEAVNSDMSTEPQSKTEISDSGECHAVTSSTEVDSTLGLAQHSSSTFLDNSVVWVRLGQSWWPGTIVALERCPRDFLCDLKKTPLAVVKFFEENGYVDIHKSEHIYSYNCSRKREFIKKGISFHIRRAHHYMGRASENNLKTVQNKIGLFKKFEADVLTAEKLTGGSQEIFSQIEEECKNRMDYSNLGFGPPKPKRKREDGPRKTSSDISEAVRYKKEANHSGSVLKHRIIEHKVKIMEQPHVENMREDLDKSCNVYKCPVCSYSCTRLGVILWHHKGHIKTVIDYDRGIRMPGRKRRKYKKKIAATQQKANGFVDQQEAGPSGTHQANQLLMDWDDEEGGEPAASQDNSVSTTEKHVNGHVNNASDNSDEDMSGDDDDNEMSYNQSRNEPVYSRPPMLGAEDLNSAFDALLADTPNSNSLSSSRAPQDNDFRGNQSDSDASDWEKYYDKDAEDDEGEQESDIKSLCEGLDQARPRVSNGIANGGAAIGEAGVSTEDDEEEEEEEEDVKITPVEGMDNNKEEATDETAKEEKEEEPVQTEVIEEKMEIDREEEAEPKAAVSEESSSTTSSSSPSTSAGPAYMLVAVDAQGNNVPMPALTDRNHSSNLVAVEASMEDGTSRTLYIDPAYLEPNVDLSNLMLHIDNSGQETVIIPSSAAQDVGDSSEAVLEEGLYDSRDPTTGLSSADDSEQSPSEALQATPSQLIMQESSQTHRPVSERVERHSCPNACVRNTSSPDQSSYCACQSSHIVKPLTEFVPTERFCEMSFSSESTFEGFSPVVAGKCIDEISANSSCDVVSRKKSAVASNSETETCSKVACALLPDNELAHDGVDIPCSQLLVEMEEKPLTQSNKVDNVELVIANELDATILDFGVSIANLNDAANNLAGGNLLDSEFVGSEPVTISAQFGEPSTQTKRDDNDILLGDKCEDINADSQTMSTERKSQIISVPDVDIHLGSCDVHTKFDKETFFPPDESNSYSVSHNYKKINKVSSLQTFTSHCMEKKEKNQTSLLATSQFTLDSNIENSEVKDGPRFSISTAEFSCNPTTPIAEKNVVDEMHLLPTVDLPLSSNSYNVTEKKELFYNSNSHDVKKEMSQELLLAPESSFNSNCKYFDKKEIQIPPLPTDKVGFNASSVGVVKDSSPDLLTAAGILSLTSQKLEKKKENQTSLLTTAEIIQDTVRKVANFDYKKSSNQDSCYSVLPQIIKSTKSCLVTQPLNRSFEVDTCSSVLKKRYNLSIYKPDDKKRPINVGSTFKNLQKNFIKVTKPPISNTLPKAALRCSGTNVNDDFVRFAKAADGLISYLEEYKRSKVAHSPVRLKTFVGDSVQVAVSSSKPMFQWKPPQSPKCFDQYKKFNQGSIQPKYRFTVPSSMHHLGSLSTSYGTTSQLDIKGRSEQGLGYLVAPSKINAENKMVKQLKNSPDFNQQFQLDSSADKLISILAANSTNTFATQVSPTASISLSPTKTSSPVSQFSELKSVKGAGNSVSTSSQFPSTSQQQKSRAHSPLDGSKTPTSISPIKLKTFVSTVRTSNVAQHVTENKSDAVSKIEETSATDTAEVRPTSESQANRIGASDASNSHVSIEQASGVSLPVSSMHLAPGTLGSSTCTATMSSFEQRDFLLTDSLSDGMIAVRNATSDSERIEHKHWRDVHNLSLKQTETVQIPSSAACQTKSLSVSHETGYFRKAPNSETTHSQSCPGKKDTSSGDEHEEELPDLGSISEGEKETLKIPLYLVHSCVWVNLTQSPGKVLWWPGVVVNIDNSSSSYTVRLIKPNRRHNHLIRKLNSSGGDLANKSADTVANDEDEVTVHSTYLERFDAERLSFISKRSSDLWEAFVAANRYERLRVSKKEILSPEAFFALSTNEQEKLLAVSDISKPVKSLSPKKTDGKRIFEKKAELVDEELDEELRKEYPSMFSTPLLEEPEEDNVTLSSRDYRKHKSAVKAKRRDNKSLLKFMKGEDCLSYLLDVMSGRISSELHRRYQDPANWAAMKSNLKLGPLRSDEFQDSVNRMVIYLRDKLTAVQPDFQDPSQYVILVWLPEAIRHALRVVKRVPEDGLDEALEHGLNESAVERKARRLFH